MEQPLSNIAVDPKVLQMFKSSAGENGSAFLAELIDCYLEESSQQVQAMKAAVAQGNVNNVRREAHILKSNSAAIGANNLAKLCKELEAIASPDEMRSALQKVLQLEVEYQKVATALSIERQGSQI